MANTVSRMDVLPKTTISSGLGLLLPGGGSRCAFQVGALIALKERGIHFDSALGVSSGGWNAAAYVLDEVDRLPEMWISLLSESQHSKTFDQWRVNLSPWNFRWMHMRVSIEMLDWERIVECSTEFIVGLTAFPSMKLKLLSSFEHPRTDFFQAVLASNTLIPFYTFPTRVGGKLYIDGGITDNAPVEPMLARGCSRVIAVSMGPQGRLDRKPVRPWGYTRPHERLTIIHPKKQLALNFNDFDLDKVQEAIDWGYEAAIKADL